MSFLSFAAVVFTSHADGKLYPWLGIDILLLAILLILPVFFIQIEDHISIHLFVIIFFSISFRVFIYVFPASMIGFDPDRYALWVQGIIETGSIDVISGPFYSDAPLFDILPAVFGLLADIAAPSGMMLYPLLIGLLFPLTSYLIVRRIASKPTIKIALAAAVVASVGRMSLTLSYQPISQTLGALLWCGFLLVVFAYISTHDIRHFVLTTLLFISLTLTHKLPPTLIVAIFIGFFLFNYVNKTPVLYPYFKRTQKGMGSKTLKPSIVILTLLSLLILYIQYFNFGGLGQQMIVRVSLLAGAESNTALYQSAATYTSAVPVQQQLLDIFLRRGYLFVLPLSGVAWLLVACNKRRPEHYLLLSIAAVTTLFMIGSLIDPAVGSISRSVFLAEPVLAALLTIGFLDTPPSLLKKTNVSKHIYTLGFLLLIVVIVAQATSIIVALPDQPGDSRTYLTKGETSGIIFSHEYGTDNTSADTYYASETPIELIQKYESSRIQSYDPQVLFNSNLSRLENKLVLYRSGIDIYRSSNGDYKILWDPNKRLSQQFDRIFSNGEVILVSR